MLWLTSFVARRAGFDYKDQVAIQFCGTKKSLASGLPIDVHDRLGYRVVDADTAHKLTGHRHAGWVVPMLDP